jgi:serine/threonine-protein kinase
MKHMREPVPHLREFVEGAPETLDRLVFELMAKSPAARPVDAHRVQATLVSIANALRVPVPSEMEPNAPPNSRSFRGSIDAWHRRTDLFDQMLARGFGAAPPLELTRLLDLLKGHQREIGSLRESALEEQQRLEGIENESREVRLRLGKEMDTLTIETSRTREEARALRAAVAPLTEASQAFRPQVLAAHKELVQWEGRSGFAEPYRELAASHRKLGDLMDLWFDARQRELAASEEAAEKERAIAQVDHQIKGLRESLAAFDKSIEELRGECQQRIAEMGRRTERLEDELLHLAGRFCAPLRARPELSSLFFELEKVRA